MSRFKSLVDSEEGMENFMAQYRIPLGVGMRYCKEGQWFEERQEGEVVIPMITFIEGKSPWVVSLETILGLIG